MKPRYNPALLFWYVIFRRYALTPNEIMGLAVCAVQQNRMLGRDEHTPVRIGQFIVGQGVHRMI